MSNILSAGTPAPDFTLHVTLDQMLSFKELRGRPVILAFYPATGAQCAGTRWRSTTRSCPSFTDLTPS
jgi:peroxiredoxin